MNNVNSTIDLTLLPDATLHSVAKKIVSALADNESIHSATFSLKDVTKAMANFQAASSNAIEDDQTSLLVRDLAKEALISVLNSISEQGNLFAKWKLSLS